jgi:DNA-binding beta-propeller fold protein YncE
LHVFPDLVRLEKKYPKNLVVIGVHTPKFDSEKETASVKKAMLRYQLNHPVVNDAERKIAQAYQASGWPTTYMIDPEGKLVGKMNAEKIYDVMDKALTQLIKVHRAKKTLKEELLPFQKEIAAEKKTSPLFFPGKVLADEAGGRLFIADSTHHRVVVTDLKGKKIAVAGTGKPGLTNGDFAKAQFNDPQGLALRGNTLYVADRANMVIRALDLKDHTVKTIAGTGKQSYDKFKNGKPLTIGLNSPWGLYYQDNKLWIGMAGHHQIWTLDLAKNYLYPFAGNGNEDLIDGARGSCVMAQPSGIGSDGTTLFIADSESSSIRQVVMNGSGPMLTIVGKGLMVWGDKDGQGDDVRLQHPLDVVFHKGKLYLTDTYNHKIKILDPKTRACTTLEVEDEGSTKGPAFDEPAGLSIAGDKLYVADTNAHRIRVVDLNTKKVSTLTISGLQVP